MTHLKRWLTSIVAIPILLLIIGPGPRWLFHSLVTLASLVALNEFLQITSPSLPRAARVLAFILSIGLLYFTSQGFFLVTPALLSLSIIFLLCLFLFSSSSERPNAVEHIGKIALGLIYICVPLSLLIVIDKDPGGNRWIFFLLLVVFFSDTGAFYAGQFFGRHKLYPSISPGKTWEGSVGGFLASLLAALLCPLLLSLPQPVRTLLTLAACLSVTEQVGDLAESMLKRIYRIKDSGNILPGHGGLLDRIDGLLFSIPVLHLFLSWPIL